MAEEKNTTKKSSEVKSEKRFCTKCGKELSVDEVCSCASNETAAVTINSDAIVNTAKSSLNTIVNVFKKPDTTIKEEISKKENTISIVLIVFLAISFALYLMAIVSNSVDAASNATLGLTTIVTDQISYFKVFIYGVLIYALMAVIPMFAAFIIGKITKNSNLTFKKAFKLYTTSQAPLIFTYLIMAIVLLINVSLLNAIGLIGMGVVSIFCFFNFILGFNKETTIREDRRSWAVTSLVTIWVVIEVIALVIIIGSVGLDTYNNNSNNYNYGNNNSFKW